MRWRDARLAAAVRNLFRRLDRQITVFRKATRLACLPQCGECCLSPSVEATVLEMLPLALHLARHGRLEQTLERLGGEELTPLCIFYSERPIGRLGGHCSVYPLRPLACRLFGFGAMLDKDGRPELVRCRLIRENDPQRVEAAARAVAQGLVPVPIMRDYALEMYRLDPVLGSGTAPINAALKQALERVGFHLQQSRRSGLR